MFIKDMDEIIATRTINYIEQDKKVSLVEVAIGRPKQFPDSTDYYAPYRIKGAGIVKLGYVGGVDAVQALQLVMLGIGSDLLAISKKIPGKLQWISNETGDFGFPS